MTMGPCPQAVNRSMRTAGFRGPNERPALCSIRNAYLEDLQLPMCWQGPL